MEKAKIREIRRRNKRERNAATVKFISQLYHCIVALGLNANAKSSFIHLFKIFLAIQHFCFVFCEFSECLKITDDKFGEKNNGVL